MVKRERWTENDLNELFEEEQDHFERKSGRLFESGKDDFLNTLAKALSAFSNSGGGTIVIGVANDGMFDGIAPVVGRQNIHDWIEKQIPALTDYPLADFRVHTVQRASESKIPLDREVIVVDVGDSAAAPHQSKRDKIYYRREGSHSVPAPHFHLELLRNRLTNSVLNLTLIGINLSTSYEPADEDGLFFVFDLKFKVKNIGRISANNWQINIRTAQWDKEISLRQNDLMFSGFLRQKIVRSWSTTVPMGSRAILPECSYVESIKMGLMLRPRLRTVEDTTADLDYMISSLRIGCQVATETSPGEIELISLAPLYESRRLIDEAVRMCPGFFTGSPHDGQA